MTRGTRGVATSVAAFLLATLLALPAAAFPGPPAGPPGQADGDRQPGNPVAHCLPDRSDDEPEPEPEPEPETSTVATDVEEGDESEEESEEDESEESEEDESEDTRGPVAECVLASLPDIVGNAHASAIVAVVAGGIANGFSDGSYRPQQSVTRAQMATFLTRALDLAAESDSGFSDVSGNPHEAAIDAVVESGIAEGFADGTFRPNLPVTRAQMAAFLTRALDLAAEQAGSLPDVAGHAHEAAINALLGAGITQGFADGTFRPQHSVTRGQMATFLTRALDV